MLNITNDIFTASEEFVIQLLRARLHNEKVTTTSEQSIDWHAVVEYCIQQRVLLICYEILKSIPGMAPEEFLVKSKKLYHQNALRNIRYAQEIIQLNRILSSVNIPLILMKGIGLSQILYNDPALRPCVDIDIIVPGPYLKNAYDILYHRGYVDTVNWHPLRKKIGKVLSHHWQFYNPQKNLILELHRKYIASSRSAHISIDGIWGRSRKLPLLNEQILVMGDEDLFLYLIIHNSKELWSTLLHLFDIATLIIIRPAIDWELIIREARAGRCLKRMILTLYLIKEIFGVQPPFNIQIILDKQKINLQILDVALARYFQSLRKVPRVWSYNLWIDLNLADGFIDKISILGYTFINQILKLLELLKSLQRVFK